MGRPRSESPIARKRRFVNWMKERFLLRFHMTVILGLTFAAGLFVTKVFLVHGNTNLAIRYAVAVAVSYLAFLGLLKAWIWWMTDEPSHAGADDIENALDLADVASDLTRGTAPQGFHGGGGSFGGGGASSSWGESSSSGGSDLSLDVGDADEGLLIVIAIVVVGIALSMLYLIYAAPTILAEVAFDALLAGSLIRGARRASSPDWVGGAVRATIVPFVITFVLATGFGWFAGQRCPQARKAMEVLDCGRSRL